MKNIGGSSVQLKDLTGNFDSIKWSRGANIDASSSDFKPGFNFKVYVAVTGNIQVVPADNDLNQLELSQIEKVYFNNVASVTFPSVAAGVELPILCKEILAAGTDSTNLIIGK